MGGGVGQNILMPKVSATVVHHTGSMLELMF